MRRGSVEGAAPAVKRVKVGTDGGEGAQMWGRGRARAVGCSVGARKEMGEEARE